VLVEGGVIGGGCCCCNGGRPFVGCQSPLGMQLAPILARPMSHGTHVFPPGIHPPVGEKVRVAFMAVVVPLFGFDVLPPPVVVIGAFNVLVVGILPLSNPDDGVLVVVLDGLKVRFPFGGSGGRPVLLSEGESELANAQPDTQ
jgi:hypothetical protein